MAPHTRRLFTMSGDSIAPCSSCGKRYHIRLRRPDLILMFGAGGHSVIGKGSNAECYNHQYVHKMGPRNISIAESCARAEPVDLASEVLALQTAQEAAESC